MYLCMRATPHDSGHYILNREPGRVLPGGWLKRCPLELTQEASRCPTILLIHYWEQCQRMQHMPLEIIIAGKRLVDLGARALDFVPRGRYSPLEGTAQGASSPGNGPRVKVKRGCVPALSRPAISKAVQGTASKVLACTIS